MEFEDQKAIADSASKIAAVFKGKLQRENAATDNVEEEKGEGFPIKRCCKMNNGVFAKFIVDKYKEGDEDAKGNSDYHLSLRTLDAKKVAIKRVPLPKSFTSIYKDKDGDMKNGQVSDLLLPTLLKERVESYLRKKGEDLLQAVDEHDQVPDEVFDIGARICS